jgi:DNA-binding CsgD family transcriptional regulator
MTGDVVRTLFGGGEPLLVIPKFGLDMVHEPRRSHGRKRQSEAFLYSRFRLTPAEAQIALGIAGGETLAAVAKGRGLSVSTARTQLKSVFAKTGTHRQAELVILLIGSQSPFAKRGL